MTDTGINKRGGWLQGLVYGLVPHTFCILFIVLSVVGATAATSLLKGLLYLPYFFQAVVILSLVFATLSAAFYLRRNGLLSWRGVSFKRKYLAAMYGTTLAVNLLLFWVVFPAVANLGPTSGRSGSAVVAAAQSGEIGTVTLAVDIPCAGHAPLIISELRAADGVISATYRSPDRFEVTYDPGQITVEGILSQRVFQSFPAQVRG